MKDMTEQERRKALGHVIEGLVLSKWGALTTGSAAMVVGRTTLYEFIDGNPNPRKRTLRKIEVGLDLPQFSLDYVIAGDRDQLANLPIDKGFDADVRRLLLQIVSPDSPRKSRSRQTAT